MDAFTHAFEAFCAPYSHPMCDAIALAAMRKVKEFLPRCHRDGAHDLEARMEMMEAASMAAVAFQKGGSFDHSMMCDISFK